MMQINRTTAKQLASFIERANKVLDEIADRQEDMKGIWAEAKACGFDVPTLKRILRAHRKDPDNEAVKLSLDDTYVNALGSLVDTPLGAWARERMKADGSARVRATMSTSEAVTEGIAEALGLGPKAKPPGDELERMLSDPKLDGVSMSVNGGEPVELGSVRKRKREEAVQ